MKLSAEQVKKVAKLASLDLSEHDTDKYSEQLSKILDYIDQLNKVDTKDIEPTFNVSGKESVTREDSMEESLTQEEALSSGSKTEGGFFVTKGVFSDE